MLQQRYERKYSQYRAILTAPTSYPPPIAEDEDENLIEGNKEMVIDEEVGSGPINGASDLLNVPAQKAAGSRCSSINCGNCPKVRTFSTSSKKPAISEIEDLLDSDDDDEPMLFNHDEDLCSPSKHPCDSIQRRHCRQLLERYRNTNQGTELEEIGMVRDRDDEYQMLRHVVLLLCLSVSMFMVNLYF